jgi:hypothetical protein
MGGVEPSRQAVVSEGPLVAHRHELLLKMYDQMFNDINRHILTVWQTIGTLAGAVALLGLVEKHVVSMDMAVALIIVVCAWSMSHAYDSAYWYNRNLIIIANIERQFLKSSDLHDIHYYFGAHRDSNKMLTHLRIQYVFAIAVGAVAVLYHFLVQVVPGLRAPFSQFQPERLLPYIAAGAAVAWLRWLRTNRTESYKSMLDNSPGIDVDSSGVTYGTGHPAAPQTVTTTKPKN